jgi:hypothetical protein
MAIDVSQIRVSACYRTQSGELRHVRAIEAGEVTYVVIFHALHRTSVGPLQRLPSSQFAREAERGEACP